MPGALWKSFLALTLFLAVLWFSPLAPWKSTSYAGFLPFPVPSKHTAPYQEALGYYKLPVIGFDKAYDEFGPRTRGMAEPIKEYLRRSEAMLEALERVIVLAPAKAKEVYEDRPVLIRGLVTGNANINRLQTASRLLRARAFQRLVAREIQPALLDGLRLIRLGHDVLRSAHPAHPQLAWKLGLSFQQLGCKTVAQVVAGSPPLREDTRRWLRFHVRSYAMLNPDYGPIHRATSERTKARILEGLYVSPMHINYKEPSTNWHHIKNMADQCGEYPALVLVKLWWNRRSAANELYNYYLNATPAFDKLFKEGRRHLERVHGNAANLTYAAARANAVDFAKLHEAIYRARAWYSAMEAVLLVDEYRGQNRGDLPDALSQITSRDRTASIPKDPFTGEPIRYSRRGDTSYLLYCPGPDCKDDGGASDRDQSFMGTAP